MTPLFLDINGLEFVALAVIAVILFGPEKLPELTRKAAQMLHYVRQMAGNAQNQLREELGPEYSDLDFRDLNPKEFVRKHLLEDVDPIVADVKEDLDNVSAGGRSLFAQLDEKLVTGGKHRASAVLTKPTVTTTAAPVRTPWDPDAT